MSDRRSGAHQGLEQEGGCPSEAGTGQTRATRGECFMRLGMPPPRAQLTMRPVFSDVNKDPRKFGIHFFAC